MRGDPVRLTETRAWLHKAALDLKAAAHCLTASPPLSAAVVLALFLMLAGLALPGPAVGASSDARLKEVISTATLLRVRSGGTCHRIPERERVLVEVTDPEQIRTLIAGMKISQIFSGYACKCCGHPTLEFYRGQELLAALGVHHGETLRWAGGPWRGDAELTPAGSDFLTRWLADRGVPEPLAEWERTKALRKKKPGQP
ncbi:MAG: hypothetical protein FJ128_07825 [Deltaproteobacteria bacterium]|nr:hypothetical protein [Deltaproteobacteria bacterium]